ncbi:MAG: 16S rRNA (guanine(527)-N(7))-methyltransferase RsmG [Saprospiraceae bacterium]|uniref:Ribosomal RNA small subunit methyltransferase G n=1 Tax=Candidatus Opimibacter skivensis TaxID=2982028 RepID=A0A9D7SWJ9_9BACT|nr:16S rRNA (guanine(527)-N(7))-methyltransferase RsmG [Candidatus Opimibacter skivensis]
MELIRKYFPELNEETFHQFEMLDAIYRNWNEKINVISRKDIDHLYEHHVLHSLAIAKLNPFKNGMEVLDFGTGGGFPGIPLAILFPEVKFTLLDSMAKKIKVVTEVAAEMKLENVFVAHSRAEDHKGRYDLVVCRAVSTVSQMIAWSKHLVPAQKWIMLKGGDANEIRKETRPNYATKLIPIGQYFEEPYFSEKYIVTVQKK